MASKLENKMNPEAEVSFQNQKEKKSEFEMQTENENEKPVDIMLIPEVDPDRFFKLMNSSIQGLRQYKLIATAYELGIFKVLRTPMSAEALAYKLGCNPELMPVFCKALLELGLLDNAEKQEENQEITYRVSELGAAYLLEVSPFFQQHYFADRLKNVERWLRLSQIMKQGPEVFEKEPFFEEVVQSMAENARCGILQETVKTVRENIDFKEIKKLLDLGGGHGLYAIAFSKLDEEVQAFVFDLPSVTQKTKEFIKRYSASNVNVIPGDFFKDDIGEAYDLIFSSFNPGGKVPALIPKIAEALNPGGIFVNRQVSDDKVKPNAFLELDWNLWTFEGVKKGESIYSFENSVSFSEYIKRLEDYGFEILKILDEKDASKIVFARKRTE